jgi:hypothetical protein
VKLRVSNSSKDKFQSCPRKWFLHYKEKLRSPKVGSALFFGNALDDAFSRLLLEKKVELSPEENRTLEKTPEEIFASRMLETKNDAGQIVAISQSNLADYYSSDFDSSLFTAEIVELVSKMDGTKNTLPKIVTFMDYCKTNLNWRNKERQRLSDDDFILYNYINWLSLNEKGKLMLDAYKNQIFPEIAEVYDIQKRIEITNEMGDTITGLIDVVASFTDKPNVPFICDNKTSSKAYSDDSVANSEQLSTYCEAEGNFNAAYLVVQKTVFKKVPFIRTQVIKDTINDTIIEKTFDIYENLCNNLSEAGDDIENYPHNWNSCFDFGKLCPYYSLCKHGNKDHLIDCSKPKEGKKE